MKTRTQPQPTPVSEEELLAVTGGEYTREQLSELVELLNPGIWDRPRLGSAYEQLAKIFKH